MRINYLPAPGLELNESGFSCESPDPLDDPDDPGIPQGPSDPGPDTDGDGTPNSEDPDIDGDGTPNGSDTDVDGDGTPNSSDLDIDGDGVPNSNDHDIDGDGLANDNDPDIDGDGTANGADTDTDGDGIDDTNDLTPDGDGDGSEVGGGGSCSVRPSCSGDAIQCAILYQTWASRCETDKDQAVGGEGNCDTDTPPTCQGDAIQCAILTQTFKAGCSTSTDSEYTQAELDELTAGNDVSALDLGTSDLTSTLSGIYSQTGASASCPADDGITVAGTALSVSYQPFCDLAALIRPIVILLFSLIGFRTVMRAF